MLTGQFYLLFYIFLAAYILGNSPIPLIGTVVYRFPFLNTILQAYIVCFGIFLLIKNYEQLKKYLSKVRSSVVQVCIEKHNIFRIDLFRFFAFSLLITFFVNVTLTKIAEQPISSAIIDLIPGSDVIQKYVQLSNNATSILQNLNKSINFGSVNTAIFYIPGLPIGTLLIFILRQLRYKSKKNNTDNFPGGTLLLLFMIAVTIVLIFDASLIIQGIAPVWDSNTGSSDDRSVSVYGLKQFVDFSQSYLINPVFYVATFSAWIFDWYLFSRIWFT